jgi:hypothetical protein
MTLPIMTTRPAFNPMPRDARWLASQATQLKDAEDIAPMAFAGGAVLGRAPGNAFQIRPSHCKVRQHNAAIPELSATSERTLRLLWSALRKLSRHWRSTQGWYNHPVPNYFGKSKKRNADKGPLSVHGVVFDVFVWEREPPAWGRLFPVLIAGGLAEP